MLGVAGSCCCILPWPVRASPQAGGEAAALEPKVRLCVDFHPFNRTGGEFVAQTGERGAAAAIGTPGAMGPVPMRPCERAQRREGRQGAISGSFFDVSQQRRQPQAPATWAGSGKVPETAKRSWFSLAAKAACFCGRPCRGWPALASVPVPAMRPCLAAVCAWCIGRGAGPTGKHPQKLLPWVSSPSRHPEDPAVTSPWRSQDSQEGGEGPPKSESLW